MSVTSLRPIYRPSALPAARTDGGADDFGMALVRAGHLSAGDLMAALAKGHGPLADRLLRAGVMGEDALYAAMAAHFALGLADFARHPIDLGLMGQVDAAQCLQGAWVPWRKLGGSVMIAAANPEDFSDLRRALTPRFGDVICVLAPRRAIEAQIMARAGGSLARRAETLLPSADSCRNFAPRKLYIGVAALGTLGAIGVMMAPLAVYLGLVMVALGLAYGQTALRLIALLALMRQRPPQSDVGPKLPAAAPQLPHLQLISAPDTLPMITIMVPLFGESRIIARLIRRLDRLDYPRARLEVIFLLEDTDTATARALAGIELHDMMRTLTVPTGSIRTKPRALNYGLSHCKGDIIGVYDAEDAPEPDQLRAVARAFAGGDEKLACLQGRLDYYNPRINWLSRCFTIEYAAWWRVILPGFARMGFALPLGGTTLFFRRAALQDLGGWDAHNVTEDAELGMRLARRGYSTQLLDSTTHEEANCRALPWVKQRSRWIKGYMMTWMTLMRAPRALLRDLGAWRFFGFQMMFASTVLQALLAPLLWTLWLMPLGQFDAAFAPVPPALLVGLLAASVACEGVQIAVNAWGLRKTGHKISYAWLPLMLPYHLMASAAAYKAAYEVLTRPFYWDKTAHGLFDR
jgi:glycosyltransferase XagB